MARLWKAGREAKKGKNDLEDYMEANPDDPIAAGVMGGFLYFADTLPAAFKMISKLLLLPSGDRDRGLDLMAASASKPSLIQTDSRLMLFSVYTAFEGRFEDGFSGFSLLNRRYPHHASFMRPGLLLAPMAPRRLRHPLQKTVSWQSQRPRQRRRRSAPVC